MKRILALLVVAALGFGATPAQATDVSPSISGSAEVGSTLSVTPGTWDSTPSVQWFRNNSPIASATSLTYQLTSADYLSQVRVVLSGSISGQASVRTLNLSDVIHKGTYSPSAVTSEVVQLVSGGNSNCALEQDLTVLCNGSNAYHQLGQSEIYQSAAPVLVPGMTGVISITGDGSTYCALKTDSTVFCWGYNVQGQVGSLRGANNWPAPTQVPGITDAVQISMASGYACALLSAGDVKCWGTINDSVLSTPTAISGISNAIKLAAQQITCALIADGTVKCFGSMNTSGDLGTSTPLTQWLGSTTVAALGAAQDLWVGPRFSCARKSNGTVKCWGAAYSPTYLVSPAVGIASGATTIPSLANAKSIAFFPSDGLCAFFSDSDIQCGGYAWFPGGNYRTFSALTQMPSLSGVKDVQFHNHNGCLTNADGGFKCWGNNDWGQLGILNVYTTDPLDVHGFGPQFNGSTVSASISGEQTVGHTITANPGDWGSSANYYFSYGGAPFSTTASAELTNSWAGQTLNFTILVELPGYAFVTSQASSSMITGGTIEDYATPVIVGEALPGVTLSLANVSGAWDSAASLSYAWYRDDQAISLATSSSYLVQDADLGHTLKVRITGTRAGCADRVVFSESTGHVGYVNLAVPNPSLQGKYSVGSTVTLRYSRTAGYTYQIAWFAAGAAVSGASASTLRLTNDLAGKPLKAVLTVTKPQFQTLVVETSSVNVTGGTISQWSLPTVSGSLVFGQTLTANTSGWAQSVNFTTYKWTRDGSSKAIGTQSTYVLSAADVGHKINVSVTGAQAGFNNLTKTSVWTSKVVAAAIVTVGTPQIQGSASVAQTLTGSTGTWQQGIAFAYQWLRDGKPIKNATKATYKLVAGDRGHLITLKVTGSAPGLVSQSVITSAVSVS